MKTKNLIFLSLFFSIACQSQSRTGAGAQSMTGAEESAASLSSLIISKALTLDKAAYRAGETVSASVTYKNNGKTATTLQRMLIAGRPPGGTHGGGPFYDMTPQKTSITIAAGASITLNATLALPAGAAAGTWESYSTVADSAGTWRDGPSVYFTVTSPGKLEIATALALDKTAVHAGDTVNATVTYKNTGGSAIAFQQLVITSRRPGATHNSGPFDNFAPSLGATTLQPGQSVTLAASRAYAGGEPDGQWETYSTVQDGAGAWSDGASVFFTKSTVATPPPTTPPPTTPPPTTPPPTTSRWLATSGNKIVRADGTTWQGRGVNMHDTRGCGACAYNPPDVNEVKRRIDEAVDNWKVTFIRLDLESYGAANGMVNYQPVTADSGYLADVQEIVRYIGTKNDVYVLLSLWVDPTFSSVGWPTTQTQQTWQLLANTFKNDAHVMFGLVNEPQSNADGAQDAACWTAMNTTVAAIRAVEQQNGTPAHIISVQGTRSWARRLDYYVSHPISAGGGVNIAYETHVYDPTSEFAALFQNPASTLPVIIGEFGPSNMTLTDTQNLMQSADALKIPYLAWTFHMRCAPNLLVDNSGGSCGVGMNLQPSDWGAQLKAHLTGH